MEKRQIINIVNFIRGCEPRCEVDLLEPVQKQLDLLKKYGFRGTFLFQYDALITPSFTGLFGEKERETHELGVWLEIVEPMVKAAGIPWRGRFPWDWHTDVGFSVGYSLSERERLVDVLFEKFREVFGVYPKTMGSWIIDAHTLAYASDKYGLDASCNCKDQWGTDGYTLWGAYYNQAYYPSRQNVFCPAQTGKNQIPTPVFRMLGSDPVAQYDFGLDPSSGAPSVQGVITLEPVYSGNNGGGGERGWVDWYLGTNFSGDCLTFAYTQAGQENSFGWSAMKNGLEMQFACFDELVKEGRVQVEPLGESGRWFKETFSETPASTVVSPCHWKDPQKQSVWYNCKNYRVNLFADSRGVRIRDLYLFREDYPERYLNAVCRTPTLKYDNLPVVDGNRFSGDGVLAGFYLCCGENPVNARETVYRETGIDSIRVDFLTDELGRVRISANPEEISLTADQNGGSLSLRYRFCPSERMPSMAAEGNALSLCYRDYRYRLPVNGSLSVTEKEIVISPDEEGRIGIRLCDGANGIG
ncbi:MAG: hypothetical protein ACI3XR_07485 [Eubacteriales bacterium]